MYYNQRLNKPQPSAIRQIAKQVADTEGALNFTIGEPDLATDPRIQEAMTQAVQAGQTHYAPSDGIPELKAAIVAYYERAHGMTLIQDQVLITNGASEGIALATHCLLNEGDKVLIPSPFFPSYELCTDLAGGQVIAVDTSGTGFKLTADRLRQELEAQPEIRLIILNYPNNPTGVNYTKAEIQALAEVIRDYDALVLSDEIYADLVYEGGHYSIYQEIPDQTILMAGVSKTYAMTGFRIGFLHLPAAYYGHFFIYHQALVTCVSTPDQYAALAAYRDCDDVVVSNLEAFKRRRQVLLDRLPAMGLDFVQPDGAFYLFGRVHPAYGDDDFRFVEDLISQAKVGVVPGSVFGPGGKGYYRLSYAASYEDLVEAMDRVEKFVKNI